MYSCVWGHNMITNRGQTLHLHSKCRKEYAFVVHVKTSLRFLRSSRYRWRTLTAASDSFCWLNKTNLITPQSSENHLSRAEANCQSRDQIWEGKKQREEGRRRAEVWAAVYREVWTCQRKPACYRFKSPFYLPTGSHCCSGLFLFFPSTIDSKSTRVLVHFTNHYHFLTIPLPPVLDGLLTYWSHCSIDICIAHTQTEYVLCFDFLFFFYSGSNRK